VGSDLDLIIVVESSTQSFERRGSEWDMTGLPVPTEALIYTLEEWNNLRREGRFASTLQSEAVWLVVRE
jgi:hypothetical protein